MAGWGKKIGKYEVTTVLARYVLDVRIDIESNKFTILVPKNPGEKLVGHPNPNTFDLFRGAILEEVKRAVLEFLHERDVTEFRDVIEYQLYERWANDDSTKVAFDFRVCRVSTARHDSGSAKLEQPIVIDDAGIITEACDSNGKPWRPSSHNMHSYDLWMPFTIDRWRKCCAIKAGIAKLHDLLKGMLGEGEETAAGKLDAVGGNRLLSAGRCTFVSGRQRCIYPAGHGGDTHLFGGIDDLGVD